MPPRWRNGRRGGNGSGNGSGNGNDPAGNVGNGSGARWRARSSAGSTRAKGTGYAFFDEGAGGRPASGDALEAEDGGSEEEAGGDGMEEALMGVDAGPLRPQAESWRQAREDGELVLLDDGLAEAVQREATSQEGGRDPPPYPWLATPLPPAGAPPALGNATSDDGWKPPTWLARPQQPSPEHRLPTAEALRAHMFATAAATLSDPESDDGGSADPDPHRSAEQARALLDALRESVPADATVYVTGAGPCTLFIAARAAEFAAAAVVVDESKAFRAHVRARARVDQRDNLRAEADVVAAPSSAPAAVVDTSPHATEHAAREWMRERGNDAPCAVLLLRDYCI